MHKTTGEPIILAYLSTNKYWLIDIVMASMYYNGSIVLSSDLNKTATLLTDLLNYIYFNIKLDYEKIARCIGFHPEPGSDSTDDYFGGTEFESGKIDCKYSYRLSSFYDNRMPLDSPNKELMLLLDTYVRAYGTRKVKFMNIHRLTVNNKYGINPDTRGTRVLDWKLMFHPTFTITNPRDITLHDLIIAVYKTKSHKFENWYEAVIEVDNVVLKNGNLEFDLTVDHGS